MIDKFVEDAAAAVARIGDGATVLIGGFGAVGQPNLLIDALYDTGARDLVIVANNAGSTRGVGIPKLIEHDRVRKMICSYPMGAGVLEAKVHSGKVELEIVPQGTLAERIRAAGAGIPAFYTPTSVGTPLAEGKEHREFKGRTYVLEEALHGDFALVEAWAADRWGNLAYRGSGRNFNPVMATAAEITIAQIHDRRELGGLSPDEIITPSVYVDILVELPRGSYVLSSAPKMYDGGDA
jgi:3-oxoadipate CoA-transferase alpha subunit